MVYVWEVECDINRVLEHVDDKQQWKDGIVEIKIGKKKFNEVMKSLLENNCIIVVGYVECEQSHARM